MDYGDRQDRAVRLVEALRESVRQYPVKGKLLFGSDLANEIEQMTDLGQEIVAVPGLLFYVLNYNP